MSVFSGTSGYIVSRRFRKAAIEAMMARNIHTSNWSERNRSEPKVYTTSAAFVGIAR